MSVLIDPYMFEMTDEGEIRNNIPFFQAIIHICKYPNTNNHRPIILYKGMLDRMNQRVLQPFPIKVDGISDPELKQTLLQINSMFNNALSNYIETVELDGCSGEQNFSVSGEDKDIEEFKDDEHYFEMLYTLLIPCYKKEISIDDRIITGSKSNGKQIGYEFTIICNCLTCNYEKKCEFVGVDDLIPLQEKLIKKLKTMKKQGKIPVADSVRASTNGDHHNHVSSGGKKFSYLSELSLRNRLVLQLLRQLGLFEVKFGEFRQETGKQAGIMNILTVEEHETLDILNVRFFAETGFGILTALYFPKGVGKIVHDYFERGQLTYQNVNQLVEKI